MRRFLFLLLLSIAPAASAQVRYPDPGYPGTPGQPITVGRPGYMCTAVGSGPMGYRSFEATEFGPNYQIAYSRAYYGALQRCQYAQGYWYGPGYGYGGGCWVTRCNRVYY